MDLGSSAFRHVEIELWRTQFASLHFAPGYTVRRPTKPRRPLMLYLGDSYVLAGQSGTPGSPFTGFVEHCSRALAVNSLCVGTSGGGAIANGGYAGGEALARWRADVVATGVVPDGLTIQLGYNDVAYTAPQLAAAYGELFGEIAAHMGQLPVTVVGACPSTNVPAANAGLVLASDAAKDAALARGWVFGEPRTGKVYKARSGAVAKDNGGAIVTAATQATLVAGDGTHPNAAGARNLGGFVAQAWVRGWELPVYTA